MKLTIFNAEVEMNKLIESENKIPVLKRVLDNSKIKLEDAKRDYRWAKRTIKQLKSLKKEKVIYIHDHSMLSENVSWLDISIAFRRGWLRQLQSKWIITIMDRRSFKSDQKDAIELGGEYPTKMFDKDWPSLYFENLYLDVPGFKSEEDVIAAFKEWSKIFLPEILDKEIKFEYKESFFFRSLFQKKLV